MLRNMVTSLIRHEAVVTTWHKAKEAQRIAEKLITHGKRNTPASLVRVRKVLFDHADVVRVVPTDAERAVRPKRKNSKAAGVDATATETEAVDGGAAAAAELATETETTERALVHKVFDTLARRYADRQGGYTRVLQLPNRVGDKARQAVLTLVDGERDIRFDLTAATIARARLADRPLTSLTLSNALKVTKYRPEGQAVLEKAVGREESRLRKALSQLSVTDGAEQRQEADGRSTKPPA